MNREIRVRQRADPDFAREVIDSVFAGMPGIAKRRYKEFLSASIRYLANHHPDRWGVTVYPWGTRLNVGWVECVVLSSAGLRVLLEKRSAPGGTRFDRTYDTAPDCAASVIGLA